MGEGTGVGTDLAQVPRLGDRRVVEVGKLGVVAPAPEEQRGEPREQANRGLMHRPQT